MFKLGVSKIRTLSLIISSTTAESPESHYEYWIGTSRSALYNAIANTSQALRLCQVREYPVTTLS